MCNDKCKYTELFSFLDTNLDLQLCEQLGIKPIQQQKLSDEALDTLTRKLACLIIGGQGDALGYVIEFVSLQSILAKYKDLYDQLSDQVSDDTQMSIFAELAMQAGGSFEDFQKQFLIWLQTQQSDKQPGNELQNISDALNYPRAPGNTCLNSLRRGGKGTLANRMNNSKGCGSIMRNGTIVLHQKSLDELVQCAAIQALITHGSDDAFLPCCFQTVFQHQLFEIVQNVELNQQGWFQKCQLALQQSHQFMQKCKYAPQYSRSNTKLLIEKLMEQKQHPVDLKADIYEKSELHQNLQKFGEGWVADEALAIALFCLMQTPDPMEQIVVAANHNGDSDSTACICGQIYGSVCGFKGFPIDGIYIDVLDEIAWVCK